jgi:hypothetical protein
MLSARTKAVMTITCVIGIVAGALTYLVGHSLPQALLATGAATGSSAQLFRDLLNNDSKRSNNSQDGNDNDGENCERQEV